ncbi:hypothetical protein VTI74DRAFT_7505 [Chaetomium olivicolor]
MCNREGFVEGATALTNLWDFAHTTCNQCIQCANARALRADAEAPVEAETTVASEHGYEDSTSDGSADCEDSLATGEAVDTQKQGATPSVHAGLKDSPETSSQAAMLLEISEASVSLPQASSFSILSSRPGRSDTGDLTVPHQNGHATYLD